MEKAKIAELVKKSKIPKPWPAGFYLKPEGKKILKALVAEGLIARDIAKVLGKSFIAVRNIYSFAFYFPNWWAVWNAVGTGLL